MVGWVVFCLNLYAILVGVPTRVSSCEWRLDLLTRECGGGHDMDVGGGRRDNMLIPSLILFSFPPR